MTVKEFRRAAAQASPGKGTGKRYPARLREFAVEHSRRELGRGRALAAVARQLGVPGQTLSYWLARSVPKSSSVVRVRIRPSGPALRGVSGSSPTSAATAGMMVMTPEGYRVVVSDVAEAAALVRALR